MLRPFTQDIAARIATEERDETWAEDYPTRGDVVIARHVLRGELVGVWVPYQVVLRATGEVVGGAGYHSPPDAEGNVEIGYGIAASAQGRGIATEAAAALVEQARALGVKRVLAHTDSGNAASRRVLENLGFTLVRAVDDVEHGYFYVLELTGPDRP